MTEIPLDIRERILAWAGEMADGLGLSPIAGQLYSLLYLSPEPICLDDMMEYCQVSKGSISTNIRALERWGAAKKVLVAGDRKDYYEANADLLRIIMSQLKIGIEKRMANADTFLAEITTSVEKDNMNNKEYLAFVKERIAGAQKIKRKVEKGMSLASSLGILK